MYLLESLLVSEMDSLSPWMKNIGWQETHIASYIQFYKGSKQDRNLTVYTRREKPGFLVI
jgi:hypothetical protein